MTAQGTGHYHDSLDNLTPAGVYFRGSENPELAGKNWKTAVGAAPSAILSTEGSLLFIDE